MKKTILCMFTFSLFILACGQESSVPKVVQDAFNKKVTTAQKVKWEQESDEWEAEFKSEGKKMSMSFDNSGNWLETETGIKKKDLPAEIFKAVNLKFNGWEIEEVESIEKPRFTGYEVDLEKGGTKTEITVSEAGEITINKVKVDDEDHDKGHHEKDGDD